LNYQVLNPLDNLLDLKPFKQLPITNSNPLTNYSRSKDLSNCQIMMKKLSLALSTVSNKIATHEQKMKSGVRFWYFFTKSKPFKNYDLKDFQNNKN
jgi:hypothetical protein